MLIVLVFAFCSLYRLAEASTLARFGCSPLASLKSGRWFKFICGASNQDLPLIRNLCLLYTLAGADCIDLSADPAVVLAAKAGVARAQELASDAKLATTASMVSKPLLMISVNDDQDLHFRKASFHPEKCPSDCPRPCEKTCPAWAIPPHPTTREEGVLTERCYGCGRCIPSCPLGLIQGISYVADRKVISELFQSGDVDAIEIHTQNGQDSSFSELLHLAGHAVMEKAQVLAISFPDMGHETVPYLEKLQHILCSHPSWPSFKDRGVQIWQTDGRPMSGDIGKGTAHAAVGFGSRMLTELSYGHGGNEIDLHQSSHFVQLAGGTNDYSVELARAQGTVERIGFGGFAFGGYARRDIGDVLRQLEDVRPGTHIEDHQKEFRWCLEFATNLVLKVKSWNNP